MRAASRGERAEVPVPGAGFFFATFPAPPSERGEPAFLALRTRIADAYGEGFLDQRADALRADLAVLPVVDAPDLREPTMDEPISCYGGSARWTDDAAGFLALIALREARALEAGAVIPLAIPIDATERQWLARAADQLGERVARLAGASHSGWGFSLAVGLARLAALDRTLTTGRWHFLDAYPPDARRLEAASVAHRRDALRQLHEVARADFLRARRELVEASPSEVALARVEATGNRLAELDGALASGRSLRLVAGPLMPARPASWRQPRADAPEPLLDRAPDAARARERRFARAFVSLHGYDQIRRNCVTELFRTIESAVARVTVPGAPIEPELARRLGGRVSVDGSLAFIPFVSSAAVDADLAVAETNELPSYRRDRLGRMVAAQGRWRTWWREGNTLTSTIYRRNPDDSFFVFFTDDTFALRPVLGAANLLAAVGGSIAGVVTLPLDHGERLRAGLRGALFSLPELAFVNIRKGSFVHVAGEPNLADRPIVRYAAPTS
jgi:hypothetical protein